MVATSSRLLAAFVVVFCFAAAGPAHAACTKIASSVNDYGKTGPAADSQVLLDKHIAGWAKERGIKKYTTGKKSVDCKLFLDFGVFDEYTCRAEATVCWEAPRGAGPVAAAEGKK
jgi:hypothetical protein